MGEKMMEESKLLGVEIPYGEKGDLSEREVTFDHKTGILTHKGKGPMVVTYPLGGSEEETGPQKTVRLLKRAAELLTELVTPDSPISAPGMWTLVEEIEDHADNGVLADDEYEAAVIWLSQQSGKPPRLVRRVLKSKLSIEREK